jgi:hypothetical protein
MPTVFRALEAHLNIRCYELGVRFRKIPRTVLHRRAAQREVPGERSVVMEPRFPRQQAGKS